MFFFISEKFILNFLLHLERNEKLEYDKGFYLLNKKNADENFKSFCLSHGQQHPIKLVSLLRAHGYYQHCDTKVITIRSSQFQIQKKKIMMELQENRIVKSFCETSKTTDEVDSSFSKVYSKCHLAHAHKDTSFKGNNLCCFICQETFPNKADFNKHRKNHKTLNIEYNKDCL